MAKLLDFNEWKLHSLDPKKAKLVHKNGHTMDISMDSLPKLQQEQIKRLKLADGGKVAEKKEMRESTADPKSFPMASKEDVRASMAAWNKEPAQVAQAAQTPQAAPPASTEPDRAPTAEGALDIQSGLFQPAVNQEAQSLREQQAVDVDKAKAAQVIEKDQVDERQKLIEEDATNAAELKKHADEFAAYTRKSPINPNHYTESLGAGAKVASAIGLFLGGFGGGSNPAQDFLNKQIDRDIQSQKDNAEQKKTVWGAYQQLYGDQVVSNNLTKVSLNDQLLHKMALASAKLGTPQAKAAYDLAQARYSKENAQLLGVSANRVTGLKNGTIKPEGHPVDEKHSRDAMERNGIKPILSPRASERFNKLQYDPTAKPQYEELKKQYESASQADKILEGIDQTYKDLTGNATTAGRVAQLSHETLSKVPFVGEALDAVASFPSKIETESRDYDRAKTELTKSVVNALKGSQLTTEAIEKVVDANTPVKGDPEELVAKKKASIVKFIKESVRTNFLKDKHLADD